MKLFTLKEQSKLYLHYNPGDPVVIALKEVVIV